MLTSVDTSLILAYILIVLVIGYFSSRKQSGADFMIANRELSLFSFVSSVVASGIGGTILVVYTAFIYEFGAGALFGFLGMMCGYLLFWYMSKSLREQAHVHDFHTMADHFIHRIGRRAGLLVGGVITTLMTISLLKQFIAGAGILSAISGWSYDVALFTSTGVVLLYLLMGGFKSVVKTDVFQYGVLIILVVVIALSFITQSHITFAEVIRSDMSATLALSFFMYGFLVVWHLNELWQRIYAAKNDQVIRKGMVIAGVCMLVIGIGIALIALSVRVSLPGIDPEKAIVYGMLEVLPPELLGLGIVLLFAAIMSTADSIVFILATNIAKDGVSTLWNKKLSSENLMRITRTSIIVIMCVGTLLGYFFRDIVDVAIFSAGIGMSIVPTIIASFTKYVHSTVSITSIVVGLTYVCVLGILGMTTPEYMMSTILVSGLVFIVGMSIVGWKQKRNVPVF